MGQRGLTKKGGPLCAVLLLGGLALALWAPAASADEEFCPPGEAAGQCAPPPPSDLNSLRGLALDHDSNRLYLADGANNRVEAFEEDGDFLFAFGWGVDAGAPALETCTSSCGAGLAGSGAGQLNGPTKVAVDNDPTSPTYHFLYVVDQPNARVLLFDPTGPSVTFVRSIGGFASRISVDVGPGGVLHVLDNTAGKQRLQRFQPTGAPIAPPPPAECTLSEEGEAISLGVDSAGSLWVASEGAGEAIRKYAPDCTLLFLAEGSDEIETNQLALDEAGSPFAAQLEEVAGAAFRIITAYDPTTGALSRRYAYDRLPSAFRVEGLAVGEAGVFVAIRQDDFLLKRLEFPPAPLWLPPPGPIVAPSSLEVPQAKLGSVKATLIAEINPEGKATEAHFEYLTQAEYAAQGSSFTGPATKETTAKPLGATGFNLKAFEDLAGCPDPPSEISLPGNKCLTPETEYRWRVVATNVDGAGEGTVEGPPFTTEPPISIGDVYATRVGTDTARLNAEVNPNAIPATGFFEYVDDAAYRQDIEAGGDGFAAATQAPDVAGGEAPLDFGSEEAFTTRSVSVYPLAPGTTYHYRLVAADVLVPRVESPEEELRTFEPTQAAPCPNDDSRIGLGAFLPDCRAYEMVSPIDKDGGDIRVLTTTLTSPAVLEQSADSGEKLAYGSVRSFGGADSAPWTSQYIAQRVAGAEWRTHSINSPRGRPIVDPLAQLNTEFKAFSAELCDTWQTTFAEPPLAAGALAGYSNLYRRTDGLCNPDGKAGYEALAPVGVPEGVSKPSEFFMELLGVAEDGSRAAFLSNGKLAPNGSEEGAQLYESTGGAQPRLACILPGGEAVSSTCTAGSATISGLPGVQIGRVSGDGERVFWSVPRSGEGEIYVRIGGTETVAVSQKGEEESGTGRSWFWGASADGSKAIFSTTGIEAGISDLYEFDVDTEEPELIAEEVLGVMGMSEDADRVYLASSKVLSGEETNSEGEKAEAGKANLYLHEAGEGGGSFEFVARLANADLTRAVFKEEYRKHTARVSPDGGHAAFTSIAPLTGYDNKSAVNGNPLDQIFRYDAAAEELVCVSCNPSGARPTAPSSIPFWQTSMHAARVLSDDGARLYFQSADALAARDTNGAVDVYQWEEPGAGGCDGADAGFSAEAGGCIDLVSSGQSPHDSRFVESSPTGTDVFFATGAGLLPQDPGAFDIYDARLGGGLPIPPVPPPPCEGDTCAAQVPPPEEPTPASSEYVAPAAAGKPARRRCPKGKRRVSRKGKSRCVAKSKRRASR